MFHFTHSSLKSLALCLYYLHSPIKHFPFDFLMYFPLMVLFLLSVKVETRVKRYR